MVITNAQTLRKAGSKAIKEGATVKDVMRSTIKPTVRAVSEATVHQVPFNLIEMLNNQDVATPYNTSIFLPELNQAGSAKKRRRRRVYKALKRSKYLSN